MGPVERLEQYFPLFIREFRGENGRNMLDYVPDYPGYFILLYLWAVFYLPGILAKRKKTYKLKWSFAIWNLSLSLISTIGSYYTIRSCLRLLELRGFYSSSCEQIPSRKSDAVLRFSLWMNERAAESLSPILEERRRFRLDSDAYRVFQDEVYNGPQAFFVALFMYLKTPELFDTIFLILQGKPVSFLHWYHHATTAIFCWHAGYVLTPSGIFFVAMNYTVHSLMYFYFFVVTIGFRSTVRPFACVITMLQVVQMLVGFVITLYTYTHYWLGPSKEATLFFQAHRLVLASSHYAWRQATHLVNTGTFARHSEVPAFRMSDYFYGCETSRTSMRMGLIMYGNYFVLFTLLFKELYLSQSNGDLWRRLLIPRTIAREKEQREASKAPQSGSQISDGVPLRVAKVQKLAARRESPSEEGEAKG